MRDIKTKERGRRPKVLEKTTRMPKELVREAGLAAKEKAFRCCGEPDVADRQDSPVGYANDKIGYSVKRGAAEAGRGAGKAAYAAGKKTAQAVYRELEKHGMEPAGERNQDVHTGQGDVPEGCPQGSGRTREETVTQKARQGAARKQAGGEAGRKAQEKRDALVRADGRADRVRIPKDGEPGRQATQGPAAVREMDMGCVKSRPVKHDIRARGLRSLHKRQVYQGQAAGKKLQAAKATEHAAGKGMRQTAQKAGQAASRTVRLKRTIEAAARAARNGIAALAAGAGSMLLVLVVIAGAIGGMFAYSSQQGSAPLSTQVLAYTALIQQYANEYGIPEYVPVIQAIMMQESGGEGTDPMQCSECPYNTQYPHSPGAITDPEYSIQVGIQYYAGCVQASGCGAPQDMDRLKLSLQGYNYGNGYISWAASNYGGYSEANALLFSQQQAAAHGWKRYGDPEYVPHVLRYYSGGNPFAALFGNEQIVSVALTQLGNQGGDKFWSWYGFSGHVNWCACFVSWCADQSGLIQSGAVPKFSLCSEGVKWFQGKGKWQTPGYMPTAGTLIFFDWNHDGDSDHVGIVEKCEGGRIYTVEGNSSNAVRQRNYDINYFCILGYGLVMP